MSFEILDQGTIKAAGTLTLGANLGATLCRAIGIVLATFVSEGVVDLELQNPIAALELEAFLSRRGTTDGAVVINWIDDTHVRISTFDDGGDPIAAVVHFMIFRVGTEIAGVVPVTT